MQRTLDTSPKSGAASWCYVLVVGGVIVTQVNMMTELGDHRLNPDLGWGATALPHQLSVLGVHTEPHSVTVRQHLHPMVASRCGEN